MDVFGPFDILVQIVAAGVYLMVWHIYDANFLDMRVWPFPFHLFILRKFLFIYFIFIYGVRILVMFVVEYIELELFNNLLDIYFEKIKVKK